MENKEWMYNFLITPYQSEYNICIKMYVCLMYVNMNQNVSRMYTITSHKPFTKFIVGQKAFSKDRNS